MIRIRLENPNNIGKPIITQATNPTIKIIIEQYRILFLDQNPIPEIGIINQEIPRTI